MADLLDILFSEDKFQDWHLARSEPRRILIGRCPVCEVDMVKISFVHDRGELPKATRALNLAGQDTHRRANVL